MGGALPGAGVERRDLPDHGGRTDDQQPHAEDEIYVVRAGPARVVAGDGSVAVGPGSVLFVRAGEERRFVDITEELEVLVVFVAAESG